VIDLKEIKYGFSVTVTVHPEKMLRKGGLKVGDKLILTKALGTGSINNALKGGIVDENTQLEVAQTTEQSHCVPKPGSWVSCR
jgi:selenide,water dikinase